MNKRYWPWLLVLLAGCHDSHDQGSDEQAAYSAFAGQYQASFLDTDNQPQLLQMALLGLDNNLVRLSDSRDQRQLLAAQFDAANRQLRFAGYQCQLQGQDLACQSGTTSLVAKRQAWAEASTLPAAGSYQLQESGGQLLDISLDAKGNFTAAYQGCSLSGHFTQAQSLLQVQTDSGCGLAAGTGLVEAHSLYGSADQLDVQLPGSVLSGYWTHL